MVLTTTLSGRCATCRHLNPTPARGRTVAGGVHSLSCREWIQTPPPPCRADSLEDLDTSTPASTPASAPAKPGKFADVCTDASAPLADLLGDACTRRLRRRRGRSEREGWGPNSVGNLNTHGCAANNTPESESQKITGKRRILREVASSSPRPGAAC